MSRQLSSVELEEKFADLLLQCEKSIAEAVDLQERQIAAGELALAARTEQILKRAEDELRTVRQWHETMKLLNEIEA